MKHTTFIEIDRASFGATCRAGCHCGWRGLARNEKELAADDADKHERLPQGLRLIWHQRPDGLWNAPCACGASSVGVEYARRDAAEEDHFTVVQEERAKRHARHPGTPLEIPPCGPKLPETTQYIPTLVFP